jgi:hypothetical protein
VHLDILNPLNSSFSFTLKLTLLSTILSNIPPQNESSDRPIAQASAYASTASTVAPNAFGLIMRGKPPIPYPVQRDKCYRPPPTYTDYYDLYKAPLAKRLLDYSLYLPGKPLFDNREVIVARLLKNHVLIPPPVRPRIN